jgi:hypothetical protein
MAMEGYYDNSCVILLGVLYIITFLTVYALAFLSNSIGWYSENCLKRPCLLMEVVYNGG